MLNNFKTILKTNELFFALLILICALLSRALFLEYTDLIDPTESRYATVAQEMLISDDWLTPKLHLPEGIVPYLGKPPLHFWLTGVSYQLLGVEEWTARLPSFLAAILILLVVFKFSRNRFGEEAALGSSLVTLSSVMFFFLAGASVTDVTLTALVTLSSIYLYEFVSNREAFFYKLLPAIIFCALGFLCKGPVAIVLTFMPMLLVSCLRRDFSWIAKIKWFRSGFIFLLLIAPWIVASEVRNPGFIEYFFWNENLARYLLKNYGDKYGSGHIHKYGSSWLMIAIAFLPWTPAMLYLVWKKGLSNTWKWITSDSDRTFVFALGLSSVLFFTFVRQLHFMYVLPSIPGLAIFTALLIKDNPQLASVTLVAQVKKFFTVSAILVWPAIISVGLVLCYSQESLILSAIILFFGFFLLRKLGRSTSGIELVNLTSCFMLTAYLLVIATITPYLNFRRSAEFLLKEVSMHAVAGGHVHKVGTYAYNNYSQYWIANAWENELSQKVDIEYVRPTEIASKDICYFMVKDNSPTAAESKIYGGLKLLLTEGKWRLYAKKHQ